MLQTADAAGEINAGGRAEAFYAVDGDRGRGGDALVEEVILAAPDAGIVVDLRRKQAHDGAEAVAAVEGLGAGLGGRARDSRAGRGRGRPANGEAHAARDGGPRLFRVVARKSAV